jgi:hypothetical protein
LAEKKSTPKIGFATAARMNVHKKVRMPNVKDFLTLPQDGMDFPSAPASGIPEEGEREVCGMTLTAAPVSTKNFCFDFASWR